MRRFTLAAATAALMMFTFAACGGDDDDDGAGGAGSKRGGTLTLAPIVAAQPWDLKDAGLGNNVTYYQPVYDPLLRLDEKGEPTPNIATEWKYDKTLTELTLTLQDGLKFTDGTPVDAEAVKVNMLNNQKGANEAAGQLKVVKDVRVVNPTTAVIQLSAPDPSFVPNLGNVAGMLASPKAIADGSLKDGPVGSGPYKYDASKSTAGSQYTFVRNPDYWNADAFPFDTVVLKPLEDQTAVLNALRSGQVNGALIINLANVSAAKSGGLTVTEAYPGDVDGIYIWDREGKQVEALGKLEVRQAINHAIDREAMVKTVRQGLGDATTQVFNKDAEAFDPALDEKYPYDVAKAKQLLADAGYPDGFEVTVPDISALNPAAHAAMTEALTAIGIKVKAEKANVQALINGLLAAKWPISFFSLATFRPWDTITIGLKKDSLWNVFKVNDPKLQGMIEEAQTATGEAQVALFKQINTYVVDQAWNAPWTQVKNAYATTKGIEVAPWSFSPIPPIHAFSQTG